jgi:ribonuclease P protein component
MVKKSFNVAALAAVRASAPKPALTALQPPDSRPVETTCGLIDPMSADDNPGIGVGFTATRKIGGAVQRNRAKRRMREAARQLLPLHSLPGHDYVFVARGGTIDRDWSRLLDDVRSALTGLANGADEPPRVRKPKSAGSGSGRESSGGSRSKPNPAKPSAPPPSAPDPPGKVSFDG